MGRKLSNIEIKDIVNKWYELEDGKIVFVETLDKDVVFYRESPSMTQKVNMKGTIMNKIVAVSSMEEYNRDVKLTLKQLDELDLFFSEHDLDYFDKRKGKYKGIKEFMNDLTRVDIQKVFEGKIKIIG